MSQIKKTYASYNLSDVYSKIKKGSINADPVGQRPPVEPPNRFGKAQGIIQTLRDGYDIGQFVVNEVPKNNKVVLETIDGGHRFRAINDYYENKFVGLDGKYFKDLTDKEQEDFESIELQFLEYKDLPPGTASKIFSDVNATTPVIEIEKAMANDVSEVAKGIRSRVSYYKEYENEVLPIFKLEFNSAGNQKPKYWKTNVNPRRKWDESVGVTLLKVLNNGHDVVANPVSIKELIDNDDSISNQVWKKVDEILNHILEVSKAKGIKLDNKLFGSLLVVLIGMLEESKNFKIPSYKEFSEEFFGAYSELNTDVKNRFDTDMREFEDSNKKEKVYMSVKEFIRKGASINYSNPAQQKEVYKLYCELMNVDSVVTRLDNKRSISESQKIYLLAKQNWKCAIDGQPLELKDAVFGHDVAYSKGGETSVENGAMIRYTHNRDMGSATIEEYKVAQGYS